jgi:hypothetical protein
MADVEEEAILDTPEDEEQLEEDEEEGEEEGVGDYEEPAAMEDEFVPIASAPEIKLFGKWSFDDIEVRDISLVVRVE